jgi:hypothetical protein
MARLRAIADQPAFIVVGEDLADLTRIELEGLV